MQENLPANPAFGPIILAKFDVSDAFYGVNLSINNIPKLGLSFLPKPDEEPLVTFPLILPMG